MSEKGYQLWLAQLYAYMPKQVRLLLRDFKTAATIWELSCSVLDRLCYLSAEQKEEIERSRRRGLPAEMEARLKAEGIQTVCAEEAAYPVRMRELSDYPYMLYYIGSLPRMEQRNVAIIGARKCSDYGRRSAAYFGRELAQYGVGIISGMATGVDGLAQSACLAAGGVSYGILGSGVDVIYPRGNRELYTALCRTGGVISEYLPGTPAIAQNFPRRNRIISALANLVLVVEAREKSGTLITVGCALDQGREVYAVPGRIEDVLSAGCNKLIREGAGVASCAEDVLYAIGIGEGTAHCGRGRREMMTMPSVWQEGMRAQLWKLLRERAMSTEELHCALGEKRPAVQELFVELMQMEIEGLVESRGGVYHIK